jgi:hypothetical protein
MDILIFKTNVSGKINIDEVRPHLDSLSGLQRYTFDLDDIDKILRVEAHNVSPRKVESVIKEAGYHCEELPD